MHEPDVKCISKGKEHKKYEFGLKASLIVTHKSGVIIGALSIEKNQYDGHTLDVVLAQQQRLTSQVLKEAFVDRGYRGRNEVAGTLTYTPKIVSNQINSLSFSVPLCLNKFKIPVQKFVSKKSANLNEDLRF